MLALSNIHLKLTFYLARGKNEAKKNEPHLPRTWHYSIIYSHKNQDAGCSFLFPKGQRDSREGRVLAQQTTNPCSVNMLPPNAPGAISEHRTKSDLSCQVWPKSYPCSLRKKILKIFIHILQIKLRVSIWQKYQHLELDK